MLGEQDKPSSIEMRSSEPKPLHRGVWADKLVTGQELPVGGSSWSSEMTTKLKLDLESFDNELTNFTPENIAALWQQSQESVIGWLRQTENRIDPFLYFQCYQVEAKMQKLLEIPADNSANTIARRQLYSAQTPPSLSQFKGKSACAERAILGQYLLQKLNVESSYIGGIRMIDAKDDDEFPEEHSFLVIPHQDKTYIFDISQPETGVNMPRLSETATPFNYQLLADRQELLAESQDVLHNQKLWYGVGDPVAGHHTAIGFENH